MSLHFETRVLLTDWALHDIRRWGPRPRPRNGAAGRCFRIYGPLQKRNTQKKHWCQPIKCLHDTHEGSQRKLQMCAYMIFRYLQSSKTDMLGISKTAACPKIRRHPHPRPCAHRYGETRVGRPVFPRSQSAPPTPPRRLHPRHGLKPDCSHHPPP